MAIRNTTLILKNSDIVNRPLPTSLLAGEPIVNTADGIVYFSGVTTSTSEWTPAGTGATELTYFEVGSNLYDLRLRNRITEYESVSGGGLVGKFLSGTTDGFVLADISSIVSTGVTDTYWTSGSTGTSSLKAINASGLDSTGDRSVSINNNTLASGNDSFASGIGTVSSGVGSHAEGQNTTASGVYSHSEGANTTASGQYGSHAEGLNTTASGQYGAHSEGYGSKAIGDSSHAEGSSRAEGQYSHAEGSSSTSVSFGSHAEGGSTTSSGQFSHAEGNTTVASGVGSHSEGYQTTASGNNSHAEGQNTTAIGNQSHSEGGYTTASGNNSHAEGNYTIASGENSHAQGQNTTSSGAYGSHAEGNSTTASGTYGSHAEGDSTTASGDRSHAEGQQTIASGLVSHSENYFTLASGNYSHAEGNTTVASGNYSHSEGRQTTASGESSHAEGQNTTASGTRSHASGYGSVASGGDSHAQGQFAIASGNYGSTASGYYTLASGTYGSHAEGSYTTASGYYGSHSEGSYTTAIGQKSHAEGTYTTAIGNSSHAEGNGTEATGNSSHAEGFETIASGAVSHAEGGYTTASGMYSHAEGGNTTSIGNYSHTEGVGTTSSGTYSHAEGSYTTSVGDYSHSEGGVSTSIGNYSHAEGVLTTSIGVGSHSQGSGTTSSGLYSFSSGVGSESLGNTSFIHSTNSLVSGDRSVVLGGQNITGTTNDTVYVPYLNLNYLPTLNNSNTEFLSRNSVTGDVEYTPLSAITSTDTYVTGYTYTPDSNTFTIKQNQGQSDLTATFDSVSGLTVNGNLTVTGNTSTQSLTANTFNITSTPVLNNSNTQFLSRNTSSGAIEYTPLSAITSNDTFVTGYTYTPSSNTFTIKQNQGKSDISVSFNSMSGLTVNGNLTVTGNTSMQSLTGTSALFSGSGTNVLSVVGSGGTIFSVSGTSGEIFSVHDNNTGPIFAVSTINNNPIMEIYSGGNSSFYGTVTVTGNTTLLSGLTANTLNISSTPVLNNSNTQFLTRNSSTGTVEYTPLSAITSLDTFVTGYTYTPNSNTFTIKQNQGQPDLTTTFNSVSGLTVNGNLTITGNTSAQSLTANTLNINTTPVLNNSNTQFLSRNTSSGAIEYTPLSAITSLDTFVTGYTYSPGSNTFTIKQNQGQPNLTASFTEVSGLTVNNDLNVMGNLTVFGTAISAFTSQLYVEDPNVIFNYNPTGSTTLTSVNAGMTIQDGNGVSGGSVNFDIVRMQNLTGLTPTQIPNVSEYTGTTGYENRGWITQLNDIIIRSTDPTDGGSPGDITGVRVLAEFDVLDGGTF
jgi:hypothetical protein